MSECIFCKIAAGEIPADRVYESDAVIAFRDIEPQAPKHVLVIPKRHVATLNDLDEDTIGLVGELYLAAKQIAADEGVAESGYRTLINCNEDGGQDVFHVHLHLMAGRRMGWPPG
jgi:histidine triad (HIT) family protein